MSKEQMIQNTRTILEEEGLDVEEKNNSIHFIVTLFNGNKVDLYPTTGKWKERGGLSSNGLKNLIRHNKGN